MGNGYVHGFADADAFPKLWVTGIGIMPPRVIYHVK
jgi:hypothetical protein